MRKSVRKPIFTVLKIIFTGISLIFIFFKLKDYPLSDFYVTGLSFKDSAVFITVILLMPVNWFAESVKWRFLMRNIHKISLKTAFRAVMTGLPFAMITPNRSGEFIGRIINMPPENRGKSAVAATVGSISQMLITVIAGVIAGILLLFFYPEKKTGLNPEELNYLKIFSVSILFFGVLFLFNLKYLYLFFKKIKPGAKITSYFEILETYDTKELFRILFFSLLRYAVFSLQFFLLLYFYKTQITFADAFTGIALTFFFSSLIPVLSIFEIGVRGSAAVIFLGMFSSDIPGIFSATALLWIINLAIPSVAGLFIFWNMKSGK